MRDLKADLELLENGFYPSSVELIETAKHAIDKAIKAEALAWELVEVLKHIEWLAELARSNSRNPGAVMSYGAEIRLAVEGALAKHEEVLADGRPKT